LHDRLRLSGGAVLIHCGDITEYGTEEEVSDFLDWFTCQPYLYKIFIGGNHYLYLEEMTKVERRKLIPSNIIYLQNSGIEISGLKFWGSPVTPWFLGMAFNEREGSAMKKVWQKIPEDADILVTHGPPKGILDREMGDEELAKRVSRIKPKIHCFGHHFC
jgi:Icc-related predicted phosphoesterase